MVKRVQHSVYASAMARHICAEGCQFVVERSEVAQGQRFRFVLDGHPVVQRTVRWVVKDRVGFAFDNPLSCAAQAAMQKDGPVVQSVDLYLN